MSADPAAACPIPGTDQPTVPAPVGGSELTARKCVPCEGGVPRLSGAQATELLSSLPHWTLLLEPDRIQRTLVARNFRAAMEFFQQVTELSEAEGHHPDLHLVSYRNVTIEIWTHAIGGLSENDFILAAKIDQLPVRLAQSK